MTNFLEIFIMLVLAYLIGAIPTSIWIGKIFYKIDIREFGSGNAGASNAIRIFGFGTGMFVLLFDMFKGFIAVNIVRFFPFVVPDSSGFVNLQIILGIASILGHIYPVYAGFRGGKGVATVFGVLLALHLPATLCAAGIFILAFLVTRYSSVGSLLAGIAFPMLIIFVFNSPYFYLKVFSLTVTVLIFFTHRKNLVRLWNGTENQTTLFKRKSD